MGLDFIIASPGLWAMLWVGSSYIYEDESVLVLKICSAKSHPFLFATVRTYDKTKIK